MITRERTPAGAERQKKSSVGKFLLFLFFLAAVIAAVKAGGLSRYLEQETLQTWIGSYGALTPVVYVLFYAIAPALFLPGLPITVAGGILFGPFWGVFYAIIGATAGACLAFLVSRYLAREWVEGQLKSPRWKRLDDDVEKHGWKVVAFTRLVPLFPFQPSQLCLRPDQHTFLAIRGHQLSIHAAGLHRLHRLLQLTPRSDQGEDLPGLSCRPAPRNPRFRASSYLSTLQDTGEGEGRR